jgi:phosphate ABC transporter phosphate-binding protein
MWTLSYLSLVRAKDHPHRPRYTYEPTGSGDGKAKLVNGTISFAGSDSALSAKEQLAAPNAWFVPALAGGVSVAFNVPGIGSEELNIPREALADVFLGKIWRWSGLAPWNPKLAGVTQNISVIVRSEDAGTTSVFTSALSSFSAEWKASVGSSSLPKWPVAASKLRGNAGVAVGIRVTPYSIGYVNIGDAKTYDVPYAKIANAEGRFVSPSLEAVQAATNTFIPRLEALAKNGSTNFFVDTVDPKGEPGAYPISTFTYVVFDADRLDCDTMRDVLFLMFWAWTDESAAEMSTDQFLSPISRGARAPCLSSLSRLKCLGESPIRKVQLAFGGGCKPGAHKKAPLLPPPQQLRSAAARTQGLSLHRRRVLQFLQTTQGASVHRLRARVLHRYPRRSSLPALSARYPLQIVHNSAIQRPYCYMNSNCRPIFPGCWAAILCQLRRGWRCLPGATGATFLPTMPEKLSSIHRCADVGQQKRLSVQRRLPTVSGPLPPIQCSSCSACAPAPTLMMA